MTIYRDGEPARRASDDVRRAKRRLVGIVGSATACRESWQNMSGDECVRRCDRCTKNVHDLGAMTEPQIEDLAAAVDADGSAGLVRFYRRADGRFLIGECPLDVANAKARTRKRRRRIAACFAGVILLVGIQAMTGNTSSSAGERFTEPSSEPTIGGGP